MTSKMKFWNWLVKKVTGFNSTDPGEQQHDNGSSSGDKPDVPAGDRSKPDVPTGDQPEIPAGDKPEVPAGDKPEVPAGDKPEVPAGDKPEVPTGDKPEVPTGDQPEVPAGDKPEVPAGDQPDIPAGDKPNGSGPDKQPNNGSSTNTVTAPFSKKKEDCDNHHIQHQSDNDQTAQVLLEVIDIESPSDKKKKQEQNNLSNEPTQHRCEDSEAETEPTLNDIADRIKKADSELEKLELRKKLLEDKRCKTEEENKKMWSMYFVEREDKEIHRMIEEDNAKIEVCMEVDEIYRKAFKENRAM